MTKKQLVHDFIIQSKMMCIFRTNEIPKETIITAAKTCIENGAKLIEITYNHNEFEEKTFEIVKGIKEQIGKNGYVGVGTVMNENEAQKCIDAGADFLVAPTLNEKVLKLANKNDLYYMPGIFTASEAYKAYERGSDIVKLFPTGEVGLDYAKALMKPLGFIKYFAVGKMTPENFEACLKIGFVGAGISSSINSNEILLAENYSEIANKIKKYVKIAKKY